MIYDENEIKEAYELVKKSQKTVSDRVNEQNNWVNVIKYFVFI